MTSKILFNRRSYIDRLTSGGFTAEQARAAAAALEPVFAESVATKSDIVDLEQEITLGRSEVDGVEGCRSQNSRREIGSTYTFLELLMGRRSYMGIWLLRLNYVIIPVCLIYMWYY